MKTRRDDGLYIFVYAETGIQVPAEDMVNFQAKSKGKSRNGIIVDALGNEQEVITIEAYNQRMKKRQTRENYVYADSGKMISSEDFLTFELNGVSTCARGKNANIIDENGQTREIITKNTYYARKSRLKNKSSKQDLSNIGNFVYADSGKNVSDEDMLKFQARIRGKGKGGNIIYEDGRTREVITKGAYKMRKSKQARQTKFVYAETGQQVNENDLLTFSLDSTRSTGKGYSANVFDENDQVKEIISERAYQQRNSKGVKARQKIFVYADTGEMVDPNDMCQFNPRLKGKGQGGYIGMREVITKPAYHQRIINKTKLQKIDNATLEPQVVAEPVVQPIITNLSTSNLGLFQNNQNNNNQNNIIEDDLEFIHSNNWF